MLITFFVIWGLLFAAGFLALAATPARTSNSDVAAVGLWAGGIAGVVTLVVAGALSLIGVA